MKALLPGKYLINILLSAVAIGVIIFYTICADLCAYLKGNILGIELQYIGIAFMIALIFFSILKKDLPVIVFLSAAIGVEFFLLGFQIVQNRYCPYCLVFAVIVFFQFTLNFDWKRKWFVIVSMLLGFIMTVFLFKGSLTPIYTLNNILLPPFLL